MGQEKEIKELQERLASVESRLQHKSSSSKVIKFVLGFIIVFVLLLIFVGVFQFISAQ